jgi:hypothetical protein
MREMVGRIWAPDLGRDGRENEHAQDEVDPFRRNCGREIVCDHIADGGEESLGTHERVGAIMNKRHHHRAYEVWRDLRMLMALGARSIAWTQSDG